ncbi:MAG TPA: acetoin utilization protein AcuC [Longimicrobiales bacterium]|nr:acetoin utilization protein AcuC [Longimicrobiales bacterium]
MPVETALIWDDVLASYRFHEEHPMNPRRLAWTVGLIRELGLVGGEARPELAPRPATDEELLLAHAPEYVAAVKRLSRAGAEPAEGARFGLGTEDTPLVEGMHEAASLVVGGTLVAAEAVMSGRVTRAFNPAGGLHHARRAEAAGFCIYDDLAVAIRWMQRTHSARVMYIDYDAHHGDGVQQIFYGDPDVLTVSFHESGTYLFPGTGYPDELGEGDGYGYSVNVPLDAHTEDDSFLAAFRSLVPELADAFRPDVIVLQNGCDAHVLDPLTHLRCTTRLYEETVKVVGEVADRHCRGRIVATGGGGYAAYTVVPRAWTLVWAGLCGVEAPDALPPEWVRRVRLESRVDVPVTLRDPPDAFAPSPRRAEVEAANARTVASVRRKVLPLLTGWGLAF